ncbi:G-protein-signaling modulator 2-like [Clytia hemisphaerica]|uniref:Tetratricopeptide repeat protein n=1 Tax=Clytia hemisphaerica TaxID=252671 RepID=A0A7M5XDE7_9CNID
MPPPVEKSNEEEDEEGEEKPKQTVAPKVRELPDVDIYEKPKFGNEDVETSVMELQKILKEKLKGKNIEEKYMAYNDLGTAYYRLFKFDKAELCHHQHLQLAKPSASALALASKRPPNKKEEMIALTNLGCVYQAKREFELALQTFKKAYDIAEELDENASQARILNNMSNIYEANFDFESAVECLKSRMEFMHEVGDINGSIKTSAALGSLFILLGDIRESIMHFENAVIGLRMKIVKAQQDEFEANAQPPEGGEDMIDNDAYYDKGVA